MSFQLGKLISKYDQFGVFSRISFFGEEIQFKTIYGGILSIMIYTFGFSYFLYLMVLWQTHQIPANVTYQNFFNAGLRYYQLNKPLFIFSLEVDSRNDKIISLQKKGKIYDQTRVISSSFSGDGNLQEKSVDCHVNQSTLDFFIPLCLNLSDQTQTSLYSNSENRSQDTYIDYLVEYCVPGEENKCLNLTDQSSIFEASAYWRLTLITQDYDLESGQVITTPQDYYFITTEYQNFSTLTLQLKVKLATFIIDTGILFPKERQFQVVRSISFTTTQSVRRDSLTNKPLIAVIDYSLDRQEEIIRITYPKLGQILADLGSILQALLLFGLLMNKFNDSIMQVRIEEALLKIYFPQISLFQFEYNWRGKIKSILYERRFLRNEEFERIKQFRLITGKQLRAKLNYINILFELSRLQIQAQMRITRERLIQLQGLGYIMKLPSSGMLGQTNFIQNNKNLNYEDFSLIMPYYKQAYSNQQELNDLPLQEIFTNKFIYIKDAQIERKNQRLMTFESPRRDFIMQQKSFRDLKNDILSE